jgi:hypothetical protein
MLTRIEEIETLNLGKFVETIFHNFQIKNVKSLNLSGKMNQNLFSRIK